MLSRMMKCTVLSVIISTMALSTAAQAGAHKKCDRISGHAAAMAGCGGIVVSSLRPVMFDEIARTQHKLSFLGYDLGKSGVDGKLGPKTKRALKQFQRDHKLTVDGRIGVQTRTMLNYVAGQYRSFGSNL